MKLTTNFAAIFAGLNAVRGTAADAGAIEKATTKLLAAGGKVAKPSPGTSNTGRFTGLHIMKFQDELYGHNMLKGWGFTDAELAVAWRAEFPTAKCNFAEKYHYVTSARGDLNRNRRGAKIEQLNAQYGFSGPVNRFFTPVKEEKKVKAAVAKPKKEKAKAIEAPTPEPTVEPVTA